MANFLTSSIGKKLLMALAGLFLCFFLVVHLSINLLLLRDDGGAAYKLVIEFLTTNIFVKIMEFVLLAGLAFHILCGCTLQIQNWLARPDRYAVTYNSQTSFFSKYMIHTGVVIFSFLFLHFVNFYFVKLGFTEAPQGLAVVEGPRDFYNMALNLFLNKTYSVIYIGFFIFIGFHLNHAFQSAFQSLGINHPKYTPTIKRLGLIYSVGITFGYASIPLYFIFCFKN
jgi:succinate dehydrogenase / fumarate reductase cytochrome b subunit